MRKYYLGQRFVDYQGRVFTITDLYSSDREWEEGRITGVIETEMGNVHLQGKPNDAEVRRIGFVGEDGIKRTVLSVEEAEIYVKKRLINFE